MPGPTPRLGDLRRAEPGGVEAKPLSSSLLDDRHAPSITTSTILIGVPYESSYFEISKTRAVRGKQQIQSDRRSRVL